VRAIASLEQRGKWSAPAARAFNASERLQREAISEACDGRALQRERVVDVVAVVELATNLLEWPPACSAAVAAVNRDGGDLAVTVTLLSP
jgi:hypothetical protein